MASKVDKVYQKLFYDVFLHQKNTLDEYLRKYFRFENGTTVFAQVCKF